MWLIHEHCTLTSAIDKYWICNSKEEAIKEFKEMLEGYKDDIDLELYRELYNDNNDNNDNDTEISLEDFVKNILESINGSICIDLFDENYMVLTEIDGDNYGRRP